MRGAEGRGAEGRCLDSRRPRGPGAGCARAAAEAPRGPGRARGEPAPGRVVALAALLLVSAAPAGRAAADALHVFGPEGSPTERRALVVLEDGSGGCAPPETLRIESPDEGVTVSLEEVAGPCVRWVRVRSERRRERVTLRASAEGAEASTAASLGASEGLTVRAQRSGPRLRVTVEGAPEGELLVATAHHGGGAVALTRGSRGGFEGEVPTSGLVGVVVRGGSVVGATAHAAGGVAEVLVMPSALAVPTGGAPRTAAFVAVTDRRGRLSRNVPLRVQSERGALRSMRWLQPGVAALVFAAAEGTPSVDLTASVGAGAPIRATLATSAGWPVQGTIAAPASARAHTEVVVAAAAHTLDGLAIPGDELALRCGGEEVAVGAGGEARCVAGPPGPGLVVLVARIDGRLVPLARHVLPVEAAPPARVVAPAVPEEPPAQEPHRPDGEALWLLAALHGGLDTWGRATGGAALGLRAPLGEALALEVVVRYGATPFEARPAGPPLADPLTGTQHTFEGLAGASLRVIGGELPVFVRSLVGPALAWIPARLGQADADATALRAAASLSVGPRLAVGSMRLGAELGVRGSLSFSEQAWREAPGRFFLELGLALPLR